MNADKQWLAYQMEITLAAWRIRQGALEPAPSSGVDLGEKGRLLASQRAMETPSRHWGETVAPSASPPASGQLAARGSGAEASEVPTPSGSNVLIVQRDFEMAKIEFPWKAGWFPKFKAKPPPPASLIVEGGIPIEDMAKIPWKAGWFPKFKAKPPPPANLIVAGGILIEDALEVHPAKKAPPHQKKPPPAGELNSDY